MCPGPEAGIRFLLPQIWNIPDHFLAAGGKVAEPAAGVGRPGLLSDQELLLTRQAGGGTGALWAAMQGEAGISLGGGEGCGQSKHRQEASLATTQKC